MNTDLEIFDVPQSFSASDHKNHFNLCLIVKSAANVTLYRSRSLNEKSASCSCSKDDFHFVMFGFTVRGWFGIGLSSLTCPIMSLLARQSTILLYHRYSYIKRTAVLTKQRSERGAVRILPIREKLMDRTRGRLS